MIPDATFEPTTAQPALRLRFSLLALLVFVTLVCLLLAWWVQPNRVAATALFQVNRVTTNLLDDEASERRDERDFEIVKKSHLALLKSYFVLNAALRKPGIPALPILASQTDPVAWLQGHLEVEFPQDAEILAIRLRGTEAQANDLAQIVDAVASAYKDEVLYYEQQLRLAGRDLLARSLEDLKEEIAEKWEEYLDIARESDRLESGSGQIRQELDIRRLDRIETELLRLEIEQLEAEMTGNSNNRKSIETRIEQLRERQSELEKRITSRGEKSAEMSLRKVELEQLQKIANEMSTKLEKMDIEAQAPPRIEQRQPAVVGPD